MHPASETLYRDAVRAKICTFCVERDVHGDCARGAEEPCALESHIEMVVETILDVGTSARVDDYVKALRTRLCPLCSQDGDGFCELRENVSCALDSYLLRIVEVIEEVVPGARRDPSGG